MRAGSSPSRCHHVPSRAGEALHEPEIGSREPVRGKLRCLAPEHLLPLSRAGLAPHGAPKEQDPDGLLGIGPGNGLEQLADRRLDSELFHHLAPERVLWLFRRQDLSTRKLPEPGQVGPLEPARDEIRAAASKARRDDLDGLVQRICPHAPRSPDGYRALIKTRSSRRPWEGPRPSCR